MAETVIVKTVKNESAEEGWAEIHNSYIPSQLQKKKLYGV